MKRHLLHGLFLSMLLLTTAGCSADNLRTQTQGFVDRVRLSAEAASPPSSPENQLLVIGREGNLYLIDPAGGTRFPLTADAAAGRQYVQPAWSADGARIAWARVDGSQSFLETSNFDGSDRREVSVPFLPFYLFWSPTGDRLAYLSNWQSLDKPSMALRLVDLSGDETTVRTLAEGQPFYFSWAPDGRQLLAHIGNERVEVLSLDGEAQSLQISGSVFPAPQWSQDGSQLVFATAEADRQRLVVSDPQGAEVVELTDYLGRIAFSMSPDSTQVAYVVTERTAQAGTLGPLYVVEADTLRTREVTSDPVYAFYWSPTGDKLAYLGLEFLSGRLGLRWHVWDGRRSTPLAGFFPSRTYLDNYLAFFDQYAQSHRVWSPDGSAIVFAGTLPGGRSGVWVQPVAAESEAMLVGDGVFATWSPR